MIKRESNTENLKETRDTQNTETHTERQTDTHAYRHTHALHAALSGGVVQWQIWERRSARGRPLLTYNVHWKAVICTVSDKTSCGSLSYSGTKLHTHAREKSTTANCKGIGRLSGGLIKDD